MDEVVSRESADLYEALLAGRYHPLEPGCNGGGLANCERELVESGLAKIADSDPPRLVAAAPAVVAHLLLQRMSSQLATWYQQGSRTIEDLIRLQAEASVAGQGRPSATVISDHDEVIAVSRDVQINARDELLSWDRALPAGALCQPDASPVIDNPPPHWRVIYTSEFTEAALCGILDKTVKCGGRVRTISALPMKLLVADRLQALVPLDQTGLAGAVLFESPTVIGALCALFDAFWDRATPYPLGRRSAGNLTPYEQHTLELLVAGLRDNEIASRTNASVRTVRRNIASILDKLNVETRFAAGAVAVKRGWV